MSKTVLFLDMFSSYSPEEPSFWENVEVSNAVIDPETRFVSVELYGRTYIPGKVLRNAVTEISRLYGIHQMELRPRYTACAIANTDPRDLVDIMVTACPAARLILAGSRWQLSEDLVEIHLASNGKDQLEQALPRLREHLRELFSVTPEIRIEAHSAGGEALFAETAKIRMEAMKSMPVPNFKDAAPAGNGSKKPIDSSNGDLIFGRPFSGTVTPMSELNLDMFKVIVEGEVFAVNHRELKKRNAWVISFDMTDRTNSVRINQFMEADKAKPILEQISKPGGWLKVQGKMTMDRYDNEMVMQPLSIMAGKKTSRMDHAPEKRVELHLHKIGRAHV